MPLVKRNYFTLLDAFDRLGRMLFGADWTGTEIDCELSYQPFVSTWRPDSSEGERYKSVRLKLFESFWNAGNVVETIVTTNGIVQNGTIEAIPAFVWKCETTEYLFSISEGRVKFGPEGAQQQWRVRVNRAEFLDYLWQLYELSKREDYMRGGAPAKYNWSTIEKEIIGLYESDNSPPTASDCAQRIIGQMDEDNAPVKSQLRDRISKLMAVGLIDRMS